MRLFFTFLIAICFSLNLYSQEIDIVDFESNATFTQGEEIGVMMNTPGIFPIDNTFKLELSDASGAFNNSTVLKQRDEFFLPVINGDIPSDISPDTGYRLRVSSSFDTNGDGNNEMIADTTATFEIQENTGVDLGYELSGFPIQIKINCNNNKFFGRFDVSSSNSSSEISLDVAVNENSVITAYLFKYDVNTEKIELSSEQNLDINTDALGDQNLILPENLDPTFYVLKIEVNQNNRSAFSYAVYNYNTGNTGISNQSAEEECVGNEITFEIPEEALKKNYPGSKYTLDYGDGSPVINLSHAQIYGPQVDGVSGSIVNHEYNSSTCSSYEATENEDEENYFELQFKLFNKGGEDAACDVFEENGNGTNKLVNISLPPEPDFSTDPEICITEDLETEDISTSGEYGLQSNCLTDYIKKWEVSLPDGGSFTVEEGDGPEYLNSENDFKISSSNLSNFGPGCYDITLIINNPDGCTVEKSITKTVQVQDIPDPDFNYSTPPSLCPGTTIDFLNDTALSGESCQGLSYEWTVEPDLESPATNDGYVFIPEDEDDDSPQTTPNTTIKFNDAGNYQVVFSVTNACGTYKDSTLIEVAGEPTVDFNPDQFSICESQENLGKILDFSDPALGLQYGNPPYEPTEFEWTVSGAGVTSVDYNFVNGTDAQSQYPQIEFLSFKTYEITIDINSACTDGNGVSFTFNYKRAPAITNTDTLQEICSSETTDEVEVTTDIPNVNFQWEFEENSNIQGAEPVSNLDNTIPAMELVNLTNEQQSLTYSVTAGKNGCVSDTLDFVFNVNPRPKIPDLDTVICSGESFQFLPLNDPPNTIVPENTTYTWTVSDNASINGASDVSDPQNEITQSLTNLSNESQSIIYEVTPISGTSGNCVGENFQIEVTVEPKPEIADETIGICSGEVFNYSPENQDSGNTVPDNTQFTWVVESNPNVSGAADENNPQTEISQQLSSSSEAVETLVYHVTPVSDNVNSCPGESFDLTVMIRPEPNIGDQSINICSGENFEFTPSASDVLPQNTTYTWTVSNNANITGASENQNPASAISQTLENTTSSDQTIIYTVLPTSGAAGNCEGDEFSVEVTVKPYPVISDQEISICSGETVNLDLEDDPPNLILPENTQYSWTVSDNDNIDGAQNSPGFTNGIDQSLTNNSSSTQTLIYTVTPKTESGNCQGEEFNVEVEVLPAAQISDKNVTICSGEVFTVHPEDGEADDLIPANTTYTWTVEDNTNIDGESVQNTPQSEISQQLENNTDEPITVQYTVTPETGINSTCEGSPFIIDVTVNPTPEIQDITKTICSGETFEIAPESNAVNNVPNNTTYTWTVQSQNEITGASDQNNPQLSISQTLTNNSDAPQTVVYTVSPIASNTIECSGESFEIEITVNPIPELEDIDPQFICSGESYAVPSLESEVSGISVEWNLTNTNVPDEVSGYQNQGTGDLPSTEIQNTGSTPFTLTYEFTPVFDECSGTSKTFELTVYPQPDIQLGESEQMICSGGTSQEVEVSSSSDQASLNWDINTVPAGLTGIDELSGQGNIPPFTITNTTNDPIDVEIEVESSLDQEVNCPGNSNVHTISVFPQPNIDSQPDSLQTICVDGVPEELEVTYEGGVGEASFQWFSNTDDSNNGGQIIDGATEQSFIPSQDNFTATGSYYFYVEIEFEGNGCSLIQSETAEVEVVPDPQIIEQPLAAQTLCEGSQADTLSVIPDGGIGNDYSYQWYSGDDDAFQNATAIPGETESEFVPNTDVLGTQYYFVEVIQPASGCRVISDPGKIDVVPSPIFSTQPESDTLCVNGQPNTLTVDYENGTGTPDYQWYSNDTDTNSGGDEINGANGASFTPSATAIGETYYYVELIFENEGCGSLVSETVQIKVLPQPNIDSQPDSLQTICVDGVPEELEVTYEGGVGEASFQWFSNTDDSNNGGQIIDGATEQSFIPSQDNFTATGSYYFYVEIEFEGNGCSLIQSETAEVEVVPDPQIIEQPLAAQTLCEGSQADTLSVIPDGGIGSDYSYQWYSSDDDAFQNATAIPGETESEFVPNTDVLGTQYYFVEITQPASGCRVISESAQLEIIAAPEIISQPESDTLCVNDQAQSLSVETSSGVAPPNYQWYSNDTDTNSGGTLIDGATDMTYTPLVDEVGETYYYVKIDFPEGGCGSLISSPVNIKVISAGSVEQVDDIEVCHLNEISEMEWQTNNDDQNITYEWTNSNTEIGLPDSGTGNLPSFITQNPTTEAISATITVTAYNNLGGANCPGESMSFTIKVKGAIEATATLSDYDGYGVSCFNSEDGSINVEVEGGTPFSESPFYDFSWSGPDNFASDEKNIEELAAGEYTLSVTDSTGCSYDYTFELTAPPEIEIQDDAVQDVLCNGEFNGNILITPQGGAGEFTYVWLKDGDPVSITQDFQNIGPGEYTVIVTDANGCTLTKDYTISEPDSLEIEVAEINSLVCYGDENTGSIDIEVSGGTPLETAQGVFEYEYEWTGPDNFSSDEEDITNLNSGIYEVTVTDNLNCTTSLEIEVEEPDPIQAEAEINNESCPSEEDGSISVDISGGNEPYELNWSNGATGDQISGLAPGTYTLTVVDDNGCEFQKDFEIEEAPLMNVDATVIDVSCNGANDGQIFIDVSGGNSDEGNPEDYEYDWSGPSGFSSDNDTISNLEPGNYHVDITDRKGCRISSNYTIEEPLKLKVSGEVTDVYCFGADDGSIELDIQGGTQPYTVNWSNGETGEIIIDLQPNTYRAEVIDDNGCTLVKEFTVKPDYQVKVPPPSGERRQAFCVENNPTIADINVEGLKIIWYADKYYDRELSSDYELSDGEVLYAQNFDSELGCYSEELLAVKIEVNDSDLEIKNLITVNGNDENDRLRIIGIDQFPDNVMRIYNRYGKLVWKKSSYNNSERCFFGKSNQNNSIGKGDYLPTGTYYYILKYPSPCKDDLRKGYLQINNKE